MMKRWTHPTGVLMITACIFAISSCSKKATEPEPTLRLADLVAKPTEAEIRGVSIPQSGESKDVGAFTLRTRGLRLFKSYDGSLTTTAREGMVWVEVEYTIVNNSGSTRSYIKDEDYLKLTDPSGKVYRITHVAHKWLESTGAEYPTIAAHSEVKTSSFFEVPGHLGLRLNGWRFDLRDKWPEAEPASASFVFK